MWGMMGLQNAVNLPQGRWVRTKQWEMSTTHQQQVWAVWGSKQRTSDLTNKHFTYKTWELIESSKKRDLRCQQTMTIQNDHMFIKCVVFTKTSSPVVIHVVGQASANEDPTLEPSWIWMTWSINHSPDSTRHPDFHIGSLLIEYLLERKIHLKPLTLQIRIFSIWVSVCIYIKQLSNYIEPITVPVKRGIHLYHLRHFDAAHIRNIPLDHRLELL